MVNRAVRGLQLGWPGDAENLPRTWCENTAGAAAKLAAALLAGRARPWVTAMRLALAPDHYRHRLLQPLHANGALTVLQL
jgi:hypothetical protein